MAMRTIRLTVEYDGTEFYGWQRQTDLTTVQGEIEKALQQITQQDVTIYTAGRTDAGVHGKAQICHFQIDSNHKLKAFKTGVNRFVPNSIAILKAEEVSEHFHARFSAQARQYEFLILNRREPSALWRNRAVHVPYKLDVGKMRTALQDLIGEQDFSAFRSTDCTSSTPMCNMQSMELIEEGDLLRFKIQGDHFLHNMIRIIVGTAIDIGRGKLPVDTYKKMIQTGERNAGGVTLAPHGLYFAGVIYNEEDFKVYAVE